MALLAVQRPGAQVTLQAEALVVRADDQVVTTKPLHEIDEVHLYGDVTLTPPARTALLKRGVDTLLLTPTGRYLGRLESPLTANAPRRLAQYRTLLDPQKALQLARALVAAKLTNQRNLLVRIRREHPESGSPAALAALRQLIARCPETDDLDVLRGIEGQGAAMYFRGLSAAVRRPDMRFPRRSRRPPRDPFNACLSFGYTLLLTRVDSILRRVGLDPWLGALHEPEAGKPSLVLDLMEPFRPLVVDRLVLRLVNRGQLSPGDFVHPEVKPEDVSDPQAAAPTEPAVHLGPVARPIFLRALQEQWRTPYLYAPREARFELAVILQHQATELAQFFEGRRDHFNPYVPR